MQNTKQNAVSGEAVERTRAKKVTPSGYPFTVDEMPSIETITARIAWLSNPDFEFSYERWRHGGSYTNVRYPNGAVGCIASAARTISRKFEIACDERFNPRPTFNTRQEAAHAERKLVLEMWETLRSEYLKAMAAKVADAAGRSLAIAFDAA